MKTVHKVSWIVFYNENNQLLLQERGNYSKWGEEWAFFGGGVENGETFKEAFIREAKEELNLDMNKFEYRNIGNYIFEYPERIIHRSIFLIKTNKKESDFEVLEGSGAKYFNFEKAKKLKFPSAVDEMVDIIKKHILC